jgi:flagellar biosynthesis GTPase FlhF
MVFVALVAAVGVIVLLFLLGKLIRIVRANDDSEFDRRRRFWWRSRSTPPRVVPGSEAPTNVRSGVSAYLRASASRPSERVPADAPSAVPAQLSAAPVPSGRSVSVKQSGQSKVENARGTDERPGVAEPEARVDENLAGGSNDYGRLGEQVTAVLTTAEHAAAEIRESANHDAEAIRLEAEKHAATARTEAEALRADADSYREQTRTAADTYAEETRRAADAEAAKARAAHEEAAREMQAAAERKAKEIEAEALRRREALTQSAAHLEERIAGMLTMFRGMTTDLEELLPPERQHEEGEPRAGTDSAVDDTLEDALKPERAASG